MQRYIEVVSAFEWVTRSNIDLADNESLRDTFHWTKANTHWRHFVATRWEIVNLNQYEIIINLNPQKTQLRRYPFLSFRSDVRIIIPVGECQERLSLLAVGRELREPLADSRLVAELLEERAVRVEARAPCRLTPRARVRASHESMAALTVWSWLPQTQIEPFADLLIERCWRGRHKKQQNQQKNHRCRQKPLGVFQCCTVVFSLNFVWKNARSVWEGCSENSQFCLRVVRTSGLMWGTMLTCKPQQIDLLRDHLYNVTI